MGRALVIFILISFFLHVFTGSLVLFTAKPPKTYQTPPVEITLLNVDKSPESDKGRKQIVDQSKMAINNEVPENAKYMSRNNQSVANETRAAKTAKFKNNSASKIDQFGDRGELTRSNPKEKKKAPKKKSKTKVFAGGTIPSLQDLAPKTDWNEIQKRAETQNLKPNLGNQQVANSTDDRLKDVKTGLQTLLNTREFVYYSYYSRIKNQLRQYWEPKIKHKIYNLFRQGRTIASQKERVTKLLIVLNEAGILVGVQVLGESGIMDLDEAAIEAFREAAPFPNPPKGIVEEDGTIKIRWDFILEA